MRKMTIIHLVLAVNIPKLIILIPNCHLIAVKFGQVSLQCRICLESRLIIIRSVLSKWHKVTQPRSHIFAPVICRCRHPSGTALKELAIATTILKTKMICRNSGEMVAVYRRTIPNHAARQPLFDVSSLSLQLSFQLFGHRQRMCSADRNVQIISINGLRVKEVIG